MISSIHELLQREAQAVLNIPVTDAYEKAVELIVEQVHRKKGKLVTSGMGKAGQIAMNIATTFCSTGIPAVFYDKGRVLGGGFIAFQQGIKKLIAENEERKHVLSST
jgi:arabinose-5-phosphate isomerase